MRHRKLSLARCSGINIRWRVPVANIRYQLALVRLGPVHVGNALLSIGVAASWQPLGERTVYDILIEHVYSASLPGIM